MLMADARTWNELNFYKHAKKKIDTPQDKAVVSQPVVSTGKTYEWAHQMSDDDFRGTGPHLYNRQFVTSV